MLWFTELNFLTLKSLILLYTNPVYFPTQSKHLRYMHRKYMLNTYWPRLLNPIHVDKGPYTNNLILSTVYWVRYSLLIQLSTYRHTQYPQPHSVTTGSVIFVQSVTYLLYAFKNKPLRSLMIYFLTWLLHSYVPYQSTFQLPYGFILWTNNFEYFTLNENEYAQLFYI